MLTFKQFISEEAEQIDEVSANKLDKYIDKAQKQTGRTKGTTLALAKIMKKHGNTGVKVGANPNTTTDHRKKD